MTAKERCLDLMITLNAVCFDPLSFPQKFTQDGFRLNPADGFVIEYQEDIVGGIGMFYIEGNKRHCVYMRKWNCANSNYDKRQLDIMIADTWKQAWQEIIRHVLLSEDMIGAFKSSEGIDINVLSFKTIAHKGLSLLK